ncbi:MAG TPA: hypothetical protein VM890_10000 [Longimicrobium sp.]|jgi:hypothetical protein|nr:hypothetical protein [Longimicrobium sp.]
MTRYLAPPFLQSCIGRGRSVEQFLGGYMDGDERALRWVEIRPEPNGVALLLHQVYDEGDEGFLDVYEFTEVDDGTERDGPAAEHHLSTLEEALLLAGELYGADPDHFVNEGVIQDEYRDYLRRRTA